MELQAVQAQAPVETAQPGDERQAPLASLLRDLNELGGAAARARAGDVRAWLAAARPVEEDGAQLVAAIDSGAFSHGGRALRLESLRTLLRLGYPWALRISPEDLAWLRVQQQSFVRRNPWLVVLTVALFAAAPYAGEIWHWVQVLMLAAGLD